MGCGPLLVARWTVADQVLPRYRTPPPLYRLARALRRISVLVLVIILVVMATEVYSAYSTAKSAPTGSNFTTAFAANDTLQVSGQFTFTDGGLYPVSGFTLHVVVRNGSGVLIGTSTAGPVTFQPTVTQVFPIDFYLPIHSAGPATSLLTEDQTLGVGIWANATFGYLFPLSVALNDTRQWGAPFAEFSVGVGAPTTTGGVVDVPVTVQFQNHASFADDGTLDFAVVSSGGATCATGSFVLNVAPGQPYSQTDSVPLASGCSPAGGTVTSTYVTSDGIPISLPSESIP